MKKLLSLGILLLSLQTYAGVGPSLPISECRNEALFGLPSTKKISTTKICRSGYILEHNNLSHIPVWVSYVLTPQEAIGCFPRVSNFVQEPDLPAEASATMKQYARSGYDIGHLANSSDMRWSLVAEEESNTFANAAPQLPSFNRGIWKKLEDTTRGWVISRQHPIQIYIAPAIDKSDVFMKGTDIPVPHGFVKILIDAVTNEAQVFYMKNEASSAPLRSFLINIEDAQQKTGVVFPMPNHTIYTSLWAIKIKSAREAKSTACTFSKD